MRYVRALRNTVMAIALSGAGLFAIPANAASNCENCYNTWCFKVDWGGSECRYTCNLLGCRCSTLLGPCELRPGKGLAPF